ncbi:MAG: ATP-binding cassette domain-containing protein [Nitrospinota bacterium]
MEHLILADNISLRRNQKSILTDVSIKIDKEDFTTIIGPNGAGKTTLLKCLLNFFPPTTGTIIRKENLSVGYSPQRLVLDHTLPITTKRFLLLNNHALDDEVQQIAVETKIERLLASDLNTLSGGELQRVLLARAMIGKPDLLVLDEPTQNLDLSGQLEFYQLLEKMYLEHSISILMVSHDLRLVMSSTRNVLCLFNHICCSGKPHDVTESPEFASLFGDEAAKLISVYDHNHSHSHTHTDTP